MKGSRSFKTIALSIGSATTAVSGILLAAVLSRVFNKPDYATYRATILVFNIALPFLGMGLSNAMYFYLPSAGDRSRKIVLENLFMLFAAGMSMTFFLVLGGNVLLSRILNNTALSTTLLIAAPFAFFRLPIGSAASCLLVNNQAIRSSAVGIVGSVATLALVCLAVSIAPTPNYALMATVAGAAIGCVVAVRWMWNSCEKPGAESIAANVRPSLSGAKLQLTLGVPLALSMMVGQLSRNIDKAMVKSYLPDAAFADYVNGAVELPLFGILSGSMAAVLMADYKRLMDEKNSGEILRLLHRAMIKSGTIIIPSMLFLFCLAPEFMSVLYGPEYRSSASVFRVYLLVLPVRTIVFGSILIAAGATRTLAKISVATLIVNTILNYFAIKRYGELGAAFATVITIYLVGISLRAAATTKILDCTYKQFIPWNDMGRLFLAAATPIPVVLAILATGQWGDATRLAVTFTIYTAIAMVVLAWMQFVNVAELAGFVRRKAGL